MAGAEMVADATVTRAGRKGIWGWMLFDWAQQPFHTLLITFVFAPYFAAAVAPNRRQGQAAVGLCARCSAACRSPFLSPVLGAIADATGPRKPWIFAFSVLGRHRLLGALVRRARHAPDPLPVMFAVAVALIGIEFAAVFNNAMMPTLVPRADLGRLSGAPGPSAISAAWSAWCIVLGAACRRSPTPARRCSASIRCSGSTAAGHEGDRAAGPLTAIWYGRLRHPAVPVHAGRAAHSRARAARCAPASPNSGNAARACRGRRASSPS